MILTENQLLSQWPSDLTITLMQLSASGLPKRSEVEDLLGPLPKMPEMIIREMGRLTLYGYDQWRQEWA